MHPCEPVATINFKGERLHVALGASRVRRRLKGHGFRRVETAGEKGGHHPHGGREHLRQLEATFQDVIEARIEDVER
jgi:hypothetical protein